MQRQRRPYKTEDENDFKPTAIEKLSDDLGIPKTILAGLSHMEMLGNRQAIIDSCKGILEYNEDKIKLNLGNQTICFCGSCLSIKSLNCEQAVIVGTIMSIEFG